MVFLLAATVIAAASAPAASAPPAADAPLREVVYKVSYTHHQSLNVQAFGGYDTGGGGNVGGANGGAPISQRADVSDEGTITVDVMAVAHDAIGVKLTETWRQHPRPQVFQGEITPDGSLRFGSQPITEVAASLLPFFGPKFSNSQALDVGVKWTSNDDGPVASIATTYEVKSINDNRVTIAETEVIKAKGAAGMDSSISGSVVYLAPKLVPISGKMVRHSSKSGASDTDVVDMILNFNRTSDTLDPAQ